MTDGNPGPVYDIIQVDDDREDVISVFERNAKEMGLSYCSVGTWNDLYNLVDRTFGRDAKARVYLVDAIFPMRKGGTPMNNARPAVEAIREMHPEARIFLLSSLDTLPKLASELKVGYFDKQRWGGARDLLRKLKAEELGRTQ